MFDYIRGQMIEISPQLMIIECGGLGYQVHIPLSAFSTLYQPGETIKLYLSAVYREDSQRLFGFPTKEERETFNLLSTISGIGPKTALSLVGHLNLIDFRTAILSSNSKLLSKVPGIGKKTAERVIIELKDKMNKAPSSTVGIVYQPKDPIQQDSLSALINLGYESKRAQKALEKVFANQKDNLTIESAIKAALQLI